MADQVTQIRVAGLLDKEWGHLFHGWTVEQQANSNTIISSVNADQSAIHGVLTKVRDLNLKLVSIDTIAPCGKYPADNGVKIRPEKVLTFMKRYGTYISYLILWMEKSGRV